MGKTLKDAVFEFGYDCVADKLFGMYVFGEVDSADYFELQRKLANIRVEYEPMVYTITILRSWNLLK